MLALLHFCFCHLRRQTMSISSITSRWTIMAKASPRRLSPRPASGRVVLRRPGRSTRPPQLGQDAVTAESAGPEPLADPVQRGCLGVPELRFQAEQAVHEIVRNGAELLGEHGVEAPASSGTFKASAIDWRTPSMI